MSVPLNNQWKTLDRDLGRLSQLELATQYVARPLVGIILSFFLWLQVLDLCCSLMNSAPSLLW